MMTETIAELLGRVRARHPDIQVAGPQPEASIRRLEEAFGWPMPPGYRSFLATYGHLRFEAREVFGIEGTPEEGAGGRVYQETLRLRQDLDFPRPLLVFASPETYDQDRVYCLDFRCEAPGGERPVGRFHIWESEPSLESFDESDFFAAWLVGVLGQWYELPRYSRHGSLQERARHFLAMPPPDQLQYDGSESYGSSTEIAEYADVGRIDALSFLRGLHERLDSAQDKAAQCRMAAEYSQANSDEQEYWYAMAGLLGGIAKEIEREIAYECRPDGSDGSG
jgi:hypothetical protein